MSGERAPLPAAGRRSRSYGSLVRSPMSPGRQRHVEHRVQPGDTLPGLALKYGVSMEQIKRANRLYTNESIFLKKCLSIPVPSDPEPCADWVESLEEEEEEEEGGDGSGPRRAPAPSSSERKPNGGKERASDLTPVDYLKRLDGLISQSKRAAAEGRQDTESRVAAIEAACTSRSSDWRPLTRSQSVVLPPRVRRQQEAQAAVPLTVTKLTKSLRDREDEIFQL